MIFLNDRLVPENKAKVSVFDHGFLYGDGVYETLRVYKGTVFMIEEHTKRLFRSASMISLRIPLSPDEIKSAVYKTIRKNRHREAYVRISVSRGPGPIGLDPGLCPKSTLVVISKDMGKYPGHLYRKGVRIAVVRTRRNCRNALDPRIKSLNFLNNIIATIEAKKRGAYEAIMMNYRGYVAEGTISNIFFVKNRILCTPATEVGILEGITRRVIIDIAQELQIRVREGSFHRRYLYTADEVFISSTTKEVMPVTIVDDTRIGMGAGKLTGMIHKAYKQKVLQYIKEQKGDRDSHG
jgi:branched-chain amino acid aminotransferase